jgi:hypothetical protein
VLRDLASLMVAVAGESVTMVKRSAPERAMKLKKSGEWEIYLEFLKLSFNLADRLSAHYIPLKDQPLFMDGLVDAVTQQLKNVLAPALGPDADEMEVVLTIGQTVSQSRERYERFKFLVTEDSKQKDEYFAAFGETIAHLLGAPDNGMAISSATLCGSAIVPAMTSLLESAAPGAAPGQTEAMAPAVSPQDRQRDQADQRHVHDSGGGDRNPLGSASAFPAGPETRTDAGAEPADESRRPNPGNPLRLRGLLARMDRLASTGGQCMSRRAG